jgi:general secretion pathway protein C
LPPVSQLWTQRLPGLFNGLGDGLSNALGRAGGLRLLAWAIAALIIGLAYQLAEITVLLLSPGVGHHSQVNTPLERQPAPGVARRALTADELRRLAARDPFRAEAAAEPITAPVMAVKTPLPLALKGTSVGGPRSSYAILALGSSPEEVYRTGDELMPGVRLKAIERDRILLARNGNTETLLLDQTRSARIDGQTSATAQTRQIARADIELQKRDLGALISSIQLQPSIGGERAGGLRVTSLAVGSFWHRLGLVQGDVIQQINGRRVRSMQDLMGLYQDFKDTTRVQVQLLRDGHALTLDLAIL